MYAQVVMMESGAGLSEGPESLIIASEPHRRETSRSQGVWSTNGGRSVDNVAVVDPSHVMARTHQPWVNRCLRERTALWETWKMTDVDSEWFPYRSSETTRGPTGHDAKL